MRLQRAQTQSLPSRVLFILHFCNGEIAQIKSQGRSPGCLRPYPMFGLFWAVFPFLVAWCQLLTGFLCTCIGAPAKLGMLLQDLHGEKMSARKSLKVRKPND